ncbi:MAG: hypothetical protein H7099_18010, partial [Gemmatimonadaceae bacterium]|nr:hypothetical protein [Gemmatimonadaceae bacterium]
QRRAADRAPDVLEVAHALHIGNATGDGSVARALGERWDASAWPVMRGDNHPIAGPARAFRAGVRVMQLDLAATAHDSSAVTSATRRLELLLIDRAGTGPIATSLADLAQSGGLTNPRARTRLVSQVRAILGDRAWFDLGVWAEAAHVAVLQRQPAFFAERGAPMSHLTELLRLAPPARDAWRSATLPLRTLPSRATDADLPAIAKALEAVMLLAGG